LPLKGLGEKGYIWDNNLVLLFPFLLMFFFVTSGGGVALTDSTSHSAPTPKGSKG
jgi:hypothetical protein